MSEVGISAIGAVVPEKILTNSDLEKLVETNDEWIVSRTGIRERHILSKGESLLPLVTEAGKQACDKAKINPTELDFVLSSTLTPDHLCPGQAFEIANQLQAAHAFCFDINAACSGFIYGLATAESLLKTRNIKTGLVTAAEQLTRTVDYSDRSTCVLFGDATAAAVVTNDHPEHLLLHTELGADPTMAYEVTIGGVRNLLEDQKSDYYFKQSGKAIFKFAVSKIKELYNIVPQKVGLKPEQITYVIPHQANIRIIEAAAKEVVSHNTVVLSNIEKYGNTSSASIGLALNQYWDTFKKGDYIMLIGFGGGLAWGAALFEW
ncbi:MAG TPA: 3-oxoacyl-ACP synthase [Firmicutes bacterium]|jgi:3-oxoacyl-[acyl-carrier-protein] synthase III|nr:3-oxoacyl-ACP synthase [Bacillota bacterium]